MFRWKKNKWQQVCKKEKKQALKEYCVFETVHYLSNQFDIFQDPKHVPNDKCILNIKGRMENLVLYNPLYLSIADTKLHPEPPTKLFKPETCLPLVAGSDWMCHFQSITGTGRKPKKSASSMSEKSSLTTSNDNPSNGTNSIAESFDADGISVTSDITDERSSDHEACSKSEGDDDDDMYSSFQDDETDFDNDLGIEDS